MYSRLLKWNGEHLPALGSAIAHWRSDWTRCTSHFVGRGLVGTKYNLAEWLGKVETEGKMPGFNREPWTFLEYLTLFLYIFYINASRWHLGVCSSVCRRLKTHTHTHTHTPPSPTPTPTPPPTTTTTNADLTGVQRSRAHFSLELLSSLATKGPAEYNYLHACGFLAGLLHQKRRGFVQAIMLPSGFSASSARFACYPIIRPWPTVS